MSYIQVDASIVYEKCVKKLAYIEKLIEEERESLIQAEMRGIFFKKTREQAIKSLKADIWSGYTLLTLKYAEQETQLNQLKEMAWFLLNGDGEGDIVNVSHEHIWILND